MGYFSNGTEGEMYRERWCERCRHDGNGTDDPWCPIWNLHLEHNYGADEKTARILNELIPRSKDGIFNDECSMFLEAPTTPLLDLIDAEAK